MRAVAYTRVSTEEQLEGYSLEAQAEAIRQLCATRGWDLTTIYEERGRSGKSTLRPEFQQMIRDGEAGLHDVIVVHKLDRFSRSLLDVLTYLNRLHKADVAFVSATEDFDFSTPFGKLILAVLGAFAQWYVENLANEVRKGKKQRAHSGGWNGPLSFGYTTPDRMRHDLVRFGEQFKSGEVELEKYERLTGLIEDALEKYGHLQDTFAIPCPINAPGVLMAFTRYATGRYSHTEIAWELNKEGYRITRGDKQSLFSRVTVRVMLRNRFYLGETSYKGERLEGSHEAIVSHELFERVQTMATVRYSAAGNTSTSRDVRPYPLTGLLRCAECGNPWRGQSRGGIRYYRDPARDNGHVCHQLPKSVKSDILEAQVDQTLSKLHLALPADWQEQALQYLLDQKSGQHSDEQIDKLRRSLEQRLTRAKSLYMMGDLDDREYRKIRDEVQAQMPRESHERQDIEAAMDVAAHLLRNMQDLLKMATPAELKDVYQALIKTLYIKKGRIHALEPTSVLWAILNCDIMQGNSPVDTRLLSTRPRSP